MVLRQCVYEYACAWVLCVYVSVCVWLCICVLCIHVFRCLSLCVSAYMCLCVHMCIYMHLQVCTNTVNQNNQCRTGSGHPFHRQEMRKWSLISHLKSVLSTGVPNAQHVSNPQHLNLTGSQPRQEGAMAQRRLSCPRKSMAHHPSPRDPPRHPALCHRNPRSFPQACDSVSTLTHRLQKWALLSSSAKSCEVQVRNSKCNGT